MMEGDSHPRSPQPGTHDEAVQTERRPVRHRMASPPSRSGEVVSRGTSPLSSLPPRPPPPLSPPAARIPPKAATANSAAAAPAMPTPPAVPTSTIASYIHRFRTQPPLDAAARAARLLQQPPSHERDFWWLHKAEQPHRKRHEEEHKEQLHSEQPAARLSGESAAVTAIRQSLLPAIERMLKEEGRRLADHLSQPQSQAASRPLSSAPLRPEPSPQAPISVPSPSHRPAAAERWAEAAATVPLSLSPSELSPSAAHRSDLLRLAQELHLPGLAGFAAGELRGSPSLPSSYDPTISITAPARNAHALHPRLSTPSLPTSSLAASLPWSASASAPRSPFPSAASDPFTTAPDDVDVDDLLAQWRRSQRQQRAPQRGGVDDDDEETLVAGTASQRRQRRDEEKAAAERDRNVDDLVERVVRRIMTAERTEEKQPPPPLPIQHQRAADEAATTVEAITLAVRVEVVPDEAPRPISSPTVVAAASQVEVSVPEASPSVVDGKRSSLQVVTARDGGLAGSQSVPSSLPPSSLKARRRQLSLQLPPHPPRPAPHGRSQPSSASLHPSQQVHGAVRPTAPLLKPQESVWVDALPQPAPLVSTQRPSSSPAAPGRQVQERKDRVGAAVGGDGLASASGSQLTSPVSGAISSVVSRALSCPVDAFARGVHTVMGVQGQATAASKHGNARMSVEELNDDSKEEEEHAARGAPAERVASADWHESGSLQTSAAPSLASPVTVMSLAVPLVWPSPPAGSVASAAERTSTSGADVMAAASSTTESARASTSAAASTTIPPPELRGGPLPVMAPYAGGTMVYLPSGHTQQPMQWYVPVLLPMASALASSAIASLLSASMPHLAVVDVASRPTSEAQSASFPSSVSASAAQTDVPGPTPLPAAPSSATPSRSAAPLMSAEAAEDELAALLVDMDAPLDLFEDDPQLESVLRKVTRMRQAERAHSP